MQPTRQHSPDIQTVHRLKPRHNKTTLNQPKNIANIPDILPTLKKTAKIPPIFPIISPTPVLQHRLTKILPDHPKHPARNHQPGLLDNNLNKKLYRCCAMGYWGWASGGC